MSCTAIFTSNDHQFAESPGVLRPLTLKLIWGGGHVRHGRATAGVEEGRGRGGGRAAGGGGGAPGAAAVFEALAAQQRELRRRAAAVLPVQRQPLTAGTAAPADGRQVKCC